MEDEDELATLAAPDVPAPEIASTCLRSFMRLPALQRSAVILKDVLGHTLEEAAAITASSGPAVKSALQRGRERLRVVAGEPEELTLPGIDGAATTRLIAYVDLWRWNSPAATWLIFATSCMRATRWMA